MIQLLPLDETAPDEASPYSALTIFGIDPLYISAYELSGVGKMAMRRARKSAGEAARRLPREKYVALKKELLEQAFETFASRARDGSGARWTISSRKIPTGFTTTRLFRALKDHFGFRSWEEWPGDLARREQGALASARRELAQSIHKYCYFQFLAHQQWKSIRDYARERGVFHRRRPGFSPGRDSDAVWAHQESFDLTRTHRRAARCVQRDRAALGLADAELDRDALPTASKSGAREPVTPARFTTWCESITWWGCIAPILSVPTIRSVSGQFAPDDEDEQRAQGEAVLRAIQEEAAELQLSPRTSARFRRGCASRSAGSAFPATKSCNGSANGTRPASHSSSPPIIPHLSLATTGTHDTEALTLWWREQTLEERARLVNGIRPRRTGECSRAIGDAGAQRDSAHALRGALDRHSAADSGSVRMVRAHQSARHRERIELDLSIADSVGADDDQSCDSIASARLEGNRHPDETFRARLTAALSPKDSTR